MREVKIVIRSDTLSEDQMIELANEAQEMILEECGDTASVTIE